MYKFALAALASVAAADSVPHMIESKMHEFMGHENTDYSVVITQVGGFSTFTLVTSGTYADPNPVQTASVEKFNVEGVFLANPVDLAKVEFICYLQGVEVYKQDYDCSDGDSHCPTALPATDWKGEFEFDVPGFAPPFQYDVHVTAYTSTGTSLFELESKFYIP